MPTVSSTEQVLRLQSIVSEKDAEIAHLKALLAAAATTATTTTYADSATITLTNTITSIPTTTDTLSFASSSPSNQSMQPGTVLTDNDSNQSPTYVQKLRGEVKEAALRSAEDSSH